MIVFVCAAEMIALRPPSYHTIEDPPPYPDDDEDDEDSPLAGVVDKRPVRLVDSSVSATNRVGVDRLLANSSELIQLRDFEHFDQPSVEDDVRQFHDAVGRRRRTEPLTCRRSVVSTSGQADGWRESPINRRTSHTEVSETTTRNDDSEQSRRFEHHHRLSFGLPQSSPFSPCRTTQQANSGSPRLAGVPYSVTCPSRFDGCLRDVVGQAQPANWQVPRPSVSGDPVASAAVGRLHDRVGEVPRPQSCQASSVFEISSYIIANSASNTSVQPSVAIEL